MLLTGLLAGGASATSCIAAPSPEETITGSDERSMGGGFFDRYDGAVLARVSAVRTVTHEPGGTRITLDVFGLIGASNVGSTMVLTADDDGAMNGYRFTRGASYFIPIQAEGPQGQPNYSFICDPIGSIDGVDEADALLNAARDEGLTIALPGTAAEAEPDAQPAGGDPASSASGTLWSWVPWAAGGALSALALAGLLVLRGRRTA